MANVKNRWVGYLDRSYDQIKTNLLGRVTNSNPEMTDHSPSNIFVIIIDMFAGLLEMLGFNIDDTAREAYLFTARRFSSVYKITRLLDYRIKSHLAAAVDLKFELVDTEGNLVVSTDPNFNIPAGLILQDPQGKSWLTANATQLLTGASQAVDLVQAEQKVLQNNILFGLTTGSKNAEHVIPGNYVHNSLQQVAFGSDNYTRVDTFAFSGPIDNHFLTEVNGSRLAILKFGNSVFGSVPPGGGNISGSYYTTDGVDGNLLDKNQQLTLISVLAVPAPGVSWKVTANAKASGGAGIENIEEIRYNAIYLNRTQNRAVTARDFQDIANAFPGVLHSKVGYCCGKCIKLYIYPDGGGLASSLLLSNIEDHLECLKGPNICVTALMAGQTPMFHKILVTGNYRYTSAQITTAVEDAMEEFYDPLTQTINPTIEMSDIIIKLKGLEEVESVTITEFYTRPFARPQDTAIELDWTRVTNTASVAVVNWELDYLGASNFAVIKEGNQVGTVAIAAPFNSPDGIISFTINAAAYVAGMKWKFVTYNRDRDISLTDYTVPTLDLVQDLDLTVTVNSTGSECNTDC